MNRVTANRPKPRNAVNSLRLWTLGGRRVKTVSHTCDITTYTAARPRSPSMNARRCTPVVVVTCRTLAEVASARPVVRDSSCGVVGPGGPGGSGSVDAAPGGLCSPGGPADPGGPVNTLDAAGVRPGAVCAGVTAVSTPAYSLRANPCECLRHFLERIDVHLDRPVERPKPNLLGGQLDAHRRGCGRDPVAAAKGGQDPRRHRCPLREGVRESTTTGLARSGKSEHASSRSISTATAARILCLPCPTFAYHRPAVGSRYRFPSMSHSDTSSARPIACSESRTEPISACRCENDVSVLSTSSRLTQSKSPDRRDNCVRESSLWINAWPRRTLS